MTDFLRMRQYLNELRLSFGRRTIRNFVSMN